MTIGAFIVGVIGEPRVGVALPVGEATVGEREEVDGEKGEDGEDGEQEEGEDVEGKDEEGEDSEEEDVGVVSEPEDADDGEPNEDECMLAEAGFNAY